MEDFEGASAVIVVAEDAQEDFAGGSGGEEDVVDVEEGGIVGDEVAGFVGFELETAAEGPGAAAEVDQWEFGVVVEEDAVFEGSLRLRADFEGGAVDFGVTRFEDADLDFEAEADFEGAIAGALFLKFDLSVVADGEEDLGNGDVLFGVEVVGEFLVAEHLFAESDALAGVDAAKFASLEGAAADGNVRGGEVFENDEFVVAEGEHALVAMEAFETDLGGGIGAPKTEGFEGGMSALVGGGFRGSVELSWRTMSMACTAMPSWVMKE